MPDRTSAALTFLDREAIFATLDYEGAAEALAAALRKGLDPELDPPRSVVDLPNGQLLVMPSSHRGTAVAKLVTVGGSPWIQGLCVVFDPDTLAPAAIIDGVDLTLLRTAGLSAMVLRQLGRRSVESLLIFGEGPQAQAHADAISQMLQVESTDFIGIDGRADSDALVSAADIICCCTNSPTPLFDGQLVADHAVVIAIGSHEPDKRELDDELMRRSTVLVESRQSAFREAGDVVMAIESAALDPSALITVRELVDLGSVRSSRRPIVFKSTGMSWEDAVVASAVARRARTQSGDPPSRARDRA